MKESNYKSYDELPLFLNAVTVAKVLGIAPSSSYELMHEKDLLRLADILGHASVNTTRIYTMETGRQHMKLLERVSRVLLT